MTAALRFGILPTPIYGAELRYYQPVPYLTWLHAAEFRAFGIDRKTKVKRFEEALGTKVLPRLRAEGS